MRGVVRRYHAVRRRSNLRTGRGKGQGTSLGIDLVSRPSPRRSARANNAGVYIIKKKKIDATREETPVSQQPTRRSGDSLIIPANADSPSLARARSDRLLWKKAETIDETMDPTGKSVQRTGRSMLGRFLGNVEVRHWRSDTCKNVHATRRRFPIRDSRSSTDNRINDFRDTVAWISRVENENTRARDPVGIAI